MNKLLALLLIAFASMVTAAPTSAPSGVTSTGSTTFRRFADRFADIVDVMDYGAVCNGSTDDSAAINGAITAWKNKPLGNASSQAAILRFPSDRICKITSSLNFTNIQINGLRVDGAHIECATNGNPCIDALESRFIRWMNLSIWASGTNPPNVGVQIGRVDAGNADFMYFERPIIDGNYTLAPFYNFASEELVVNDPYFKNWIGGAGTYAIVQDGCNHFNITSQFVTVTNPVDTCQSFIGDKFFGGSFEVRGDDSVPIWMTNAKDHKWIGAYACGGCDGVGTPTYIVIIYLGLANGDTSNLVMDGHFETTPTDIFYLTGTSAAPTIRGLRYTDHLMQATNSIFKFDSGVISSVTVTSLNVGISGYAASPVLFDSPNVWTLTGDIQLPTTASNNINQSQLNGCVTVAALTRDCYVAQLQYRADRVFTKTANFPIPSVDAGITFNNTGSVGEVDFTLPGSPVSGKRYGFCVTAAQIVKVIAPASTVINVGGNASASAGNITSSQVGTCTELVAHTSTLWVAKSVTGTGGTAGAGGWTVN